ncbi:hypothetical protein PF011_g7661 [Phytophthora fragariae]|uniref:Uncharacterized protein n=1 Tax=Phytophthora fragariae TaxID=53985 RepID=A0A6A3LBE2_9STRA|nr:hypothetical protein PF011_g7661 [Phytophthora fragariae]
MEMLLSPTSDPPPLQTTLPPPAEGAVRDGDDGREEATGGIPAQPTKKQAKRGRPSKNDSDVWTEEATETLFTVRYVTAKEEFKRAQLRRGWCSLGVGPLVNKAER